MSLSEDFCKLVKIEYVSWLTQKAGGVEVGERAHVEAPWDAQLDCPGPQAKQSKILFVELESRIH